MCMGKTHTLMSATLGLAFAAPIAAAMHHSMPVASMFAFAGVTGGYGVLPDLDHPQATLARVLGPITRAIAGVIHTLSGGHRKGTHTVWFAALMVVASTALVAAFGKDAALPIAFIGFYLTAMILRLAPRTGSQTAELVYLIEAGAATAACYFVLGDMWWLPYAVGGGVVGHILGDILTVEGVPIFFPLLPRLYIKVPVLGRTDSAREHVFFFLLAPTVAWVGLSLVLGHDWWTWHWVAHTHWHLRGIRA